MSEGFPQPEKGETNEEALVEGERTPKEWRERLRELIKDIPT